MRVLAGAQASYQEALAAKRDLVSKLGEALQRREQLGGVSVPALSFQMENDFIGGTKQRIIQSDQAIVRATRSVEKALRAYLYARKQLRMIETLREKHFVEFKREVARREQKDLDDLYTMRSRLVSAFSMQDGADQPSSDEGEEVEGIA